jgi:hypothetical protein
MLFAPCGATGLASPACALPQEHDPPGCTSPQWQAREPRAPLRIQDVEPMALCRSTADAAVQRWPVRILNRAVSLAGVKDHGQSAGR